MSTLWIVITVVLVFGVVVGNVLLLKYSAKSKFPVPPKKSNEQQNNNGFKDEDDDW